MHFLAKRLVFAGPVVLGLLAAACSVTNSEMSEMGGFAAGDFGDAAAGALSCTEDAGVLTPIGAQGCGPGKTIVYRKPLAGTGASGIASAAGAGQTPQAAEVAACTETKCAPGQVAVVTYQAASTDPLADGGGADEAATAFDDGAAPVAQGDAMAEGGRRRDGGAAQDAGATPVADSGAPSTGDASADGAAPDAAPLATQDASSGATGSTSSGDAGTFAIPCGAVVTCIDAPPTCPAGQSPSYTPSGKWHCMPLCDASAGSVLITYGAQYGNITVCAPAPPANTCTAPGDVWTWDYEDEAWLCATECDNGQYDQHSYGGQTVCVPC